MAGGGRLSQILSLTKSLPKLSGGSTLRIKSPSPKIPLNVRLIPQWRNDGTIRLEQVTPPSLKFETDLKSSNGTPQMNREVGFKVECKPGLKRGSDISIDVDFNEILFPSNSSSLNDETIEKRVGQVNDPDHGDDDTSITLTAEIPENCNVSCEIQACGNIEVTGKLEGEDGFDFFTNGGDITLKKLRGDTIQLATGRPNSDNKGGQIYVSKSCEAQDLNVHVGKGGRIRAKMMNVSNADITVMDVCDKDRQCHFQKLDEDDGLALIDLSSLYTSKAGDGAHLEVVPASDNARDGYSRHARVKSNHGHISVRSTIYLHNEEEGSGLHEFDESLSLIELGGVNGSFDVAIDELNPNQDYSNNAEEAARCISKVHIDSLSPSHISVLTCDYGDVNLTLDRKLEADLRLLSSPRLNTYDSSQLLEEDESEVLQSLIDHDNSLSQENSPSRKFHKDEDTTQISILTGSFDGRISNDMDHVEYAQGFVQNVSEEPDSRFDVKTKGRQGKISIEGAAGQALEGFSGGKASTNRDMSDADKRPLVAIATNGKITLESLSWLGAIARRYGVSDEKIELGRQAQAGSRQ
jgi:hypothetical protein